MPEKAQETLETKRVKLNMIYPENLESKFVNHMIVQNQKEYFTLSFFETISPPILGETEEERRTFFETIKTVDSKCVARFIITPEKMSDLIEVLQTNFNKHHEMTEFEKQQPKGK